MIQFRIFFTADQDEEPLDATTKEEALEEALSRCGAELRAYVKCSVCKELCLVDTVHVHQNEYIGDECCWDERLRSSE